ncbi:MAG: hypothetical protein GY730_00325, partial [bacterium]|nr:hypothetical protein [bacterium]
MIKLSPELLNKYQSLLDDAGVDQQMHGFYKKWLRYYLDFCKKYHHPYADHQSLHLFLAKLKQKKQSADKQGQALKAIRLYYSGINYIQYGKIAHPQVKESITAYKQTMAEKPWSRALGRLTDE